MKELMETKQQKLTEEMLREHPSELVRSLFGKFYERYQELVEVANQAEALLKRKEQLTAICKEFDTMIGVEVAKWSEPK